ncbi:aldo/keto reductase [Vallitalea pronyensis]|uniref:Aldo/keto reductase n=1 Tax=Vallitalea pronyensis TaxID=1348613 RepID=A0A8J8MNZ9_9FIRM|nr:aldo/keto reductase [Vallitalea pronyensis]QUI24949.1 aldo/keto reductase [Vallitalea pronyensis]
MENNLRTNFKIASDAVDPNLIPKRKLRMGDEIPAVGLGTFGSDRFTADEISDAVLEAISVGYRHIDCASVYGNEKEIGESLEIAIKAGIKREDLWITSKVWNDMHGDGDVLLSVAQTLKDLRLDYLDLYLVHWPFPNYHAPGCDVDSRSENARPYIHENFMKTWRQMERLVDMGLVKNIGTSNMTKAKFELLLKDARIKPAVNEMEQHPHFQQQELFDYCIENGIQPIGFCPIGSPTRPDRDKTENDTVDIEDPVIVAAAKRLGVHPAVVCIKWAAQRGQIPIPFSVRRNEYLSNLVSVTKDLLTDEEMKAIAKIDKNCRLIKGQVFLWKDNQTWEDLWDLDGTIAK